MIFNKLSVPHREAPAEASTALHEQRQLSTETLGRSPRPDEPKTMTNLSKGANPLVCTIFNPRTPSWFPPSFTSLNLSSRSHQWPPNCSIHRLLLKLYLIHHSTAVARLAHSLLLKLGLPHTPGSLTISPQSPGDSSPSTHPSMVFRVLLPVCLRDRHVFPG